MQFDCHNNFIEHPLLFAEDIRPGRISLQLGRMEAASKKLDPRVFEKAHIACVDSLSQCSLHGGLSFAISEGLVDKEGVVEIGEIVGNPLLGRKNPDQITVADLTGVAIQDIQIAKEVYEQFKGVHL